jgi:hypothetical protein
MLTSRKNGNRQLLTSEKGVDAISDPAALDHQHRTLAAEPSAAADANAFLLRRQDHGALRIAGVSPVDE